MSRAAPCVTGLDLNSSRALVAGGIEGDLPDLLPLDGGESLPMTLSLEGRDVVVGRAGTHIARRLPHLVCQTFLPHLGRPQQWSAGRHRLDARAATALVFQRLWREFGGVDGLATTVPGYLTHDQIALLAQLCQQSGLPLVGLVPTTLATALAAYQAHPWHGLGLVLDVDDHALTWSAVIADQGQAWVVETDAAPHLGLRAWKERLLNAAADRCVRQSRRDPRDCGEAEQSLFDQLDAVMEAGRGGRLGDIAIETERWYHNLVFRPDELAAVCAPLVRQALDRMRHLESLVTAPEGLSVVLVTSAAGRLPGMTAALTDCVAPPSVRNVEECEDFGEGLLDAALSGHAHVQVLAPDAAARAACELACWFRRGDLPAGYLESAPLLPATPPEAGPARLHFHGQDYPLNRSAFSLGCHFACDLVFDRDRYPQVSSRHCEIVFDRRHYVLRDSGQHGTAVNDRPVHQQVALHPGDWISLAPPAGPMLRFLGRAGRLLAHASAS